MVLCWCLTVNLCLLTSPWPRPRRRRTWRAHRCPPRGSRCCPRQSTRPPRAGRAPASAPLLSWWALSDRKQAAVTPQHKKWTRRAKQQTSSANSRDNGTHREARVYHAAAKPAHSQYTVNAFADLNKQWVIASASGGERAPLTTHEHTSTHPHSFKSVPATIMWRTHARFR